MDDKLKICIVETLTAWTNTVVTYMYYFCKIDFIVLLQILGKDDNLYFVLCYYAYCNKWISVSTCAPHHI